MSERVEHIRDEMRHVTGNTLAQLIYRYSDMYAVLLALANVERERDALRAECQRLKGTTMLGVPISDDERDQISKDGP